mgnify:CR=1 FL=1
MGGRVGCLRIGTVGMVYEGKGRKDFTERLNSVIRKLVFVLAISIIISLLQNLI